MPVKRPASLVLGLAVLAGAAAPAVLMGAGGAPDASPASHDPAYVLGFTMNLIDGKPQALSAYQGQVVLMVNVASKCGYTPQYEGLEKLYESQKQQGLVVLGFPANNFGLQEPGSNKEISQFCSEKFQVSFPMFEKISVKGDDQHPLYKALSGQPAPIGGDPKWNFTKFLVDRSGRVVARFDSKVAPDDPKLTSKIDDLLKQKALTAGSPAVTLHVVMPGAGACYPDREFVHPA